MSKEQIIISLLQRANEETQSGRTAALDLAAKQRIHARLLVAVNKRRIHRYRPHRLHTRQRYTYTKPVLLTLTALSLVLLLAGSNTRFSTSTSATDQPGGLLRLKFAANRISEIVELVHRPGATTKPENFINVLNNFDSDAVVGSRSLIVQANGTNEQQLKSLFSWTENQSKRLHSVESDLPLQSRDRAVASLLLLDRIRIRISALLQQEKCDVNASGQIDELGPLPTGLCSPAATVTTTQSAEPLPDTAKPSLTTHPITQAPAAKTKPQEPAVRRKPAHPSRPAPTPTPAPSTGMPMPLMQFPWPLSNTR